MRHAGRGLDSTGLDDKSSRESKKEKEDQFQTNSYREAIRHVQWTVTTTPLLFDEAD